MAVAIRNSRQKAPGAMSLLRESGWEAQQGVPLDTSHQAGSNQHVRWRAWYAGTRARRRPFSATIQRDCAADYRRLTRMVSRVVLVNSRLQWLGPMVGGPRSLLSFKQRI